MSINILIIEDEALTRRILIKALKMNGLQITAVYEAENGEHGLQVLRENNDVDLVLLDLNLPGMKGEEFISHMRQHPDTSRIPVVLISGESQIDRIQAIKEMGLGFIAKPFSSERIGATIMNMISESD